MCGIAGFFGVDDDPRGFADQVERMLASIVHRGPDEQGWYCDRRAAIGNVRLAIIDISNGQQPMATRDQRHWMVFNGEVFNYLELREALKIHQVQFQTDSDTEVVLNGLAIHGPDFLKRMNGQFALCFYDREAGSFLLARDRMGERPLFAATHKGGTLFGSEIKAIVQYDGFATELDAAAIERAMRAWTCLPDETAFKGIRAIEPGQYELHHGDGRVECRYYDILPARAMALGKLDQSLETSIEHVREAMDRSIKLRLRADLEVGAYVSGGLDSTIIAGLAQGQTDHPLRTFSIRFEAEAFDEGDYQSQVIGALGSVHTDVVIGAKEMAGSLEDLVWHSEMPLYRLAPLPMYLLAKAVKGAGTTVVLTGEGADEIFLGYDIYREALVRQELEQGGLTDDGRKGLLKRLYPYLDHFDENAAGVLSFFKRFHGREEDPLFSHLPRFSTGEFGLRLAGAEAREADKAYAETVLAAVRRRHPHLDDLEPLDRAITLECDLLLNGYLLSSQGDRMASAASVEGRYPFLDPDLVELALRLPFDHRLKDGRDEKHVLKKAFSDIVPDAVLNRPKYPYRSPDVALLASPEGQALMPSRSEIADAGVFDPDKASRFLNQTDPTRFIQRENQALSCIVTTQILHRQFVRRERDVHRSALTNVVRREDHRETHRVI